MPLIAEMLVNAAMILERAHHLKAGAYERCEARDGRSNGFKPKSLQTSFGKLSLNVPQVRGSAEPFHSSLFEKGSRADTPAAHERHGSARHIQSQHLPEFPQQLPGHLAFIAGDALSCQFGQRVAPLPAGLRGLIDR